MATIVIGGSGKDIGKTALVCAVISSLRDFAWNAVKITGHDYSSAQQEVSGPVLQEETNAVGKTDTARYLAAGAHRALLVNRVGPEVPFAEIGRVLTPDAHVIFESNRIVEVFRPDLCLALFAGSERKPSFDRLLRVADAVITIGPPAPDLPKSIRHFQLEKPDELSEEIKDWLRNRLRNL